MKRFNPVVNPVPPARHTSRSDAGGPDPLKQKSTPNHFQEKISDNSPIGSLIGEKRMPVGNFSAASFDNDPIFNPTADKSAYSTGEPASNPLSGDAGGPQFRQTDGSGKKIKNWLSKYGSSVILPIIAVLILAGGIYLYAVKKTPEISVFQEETPAEITGIAEELPAEQTGESVLTKEEKETAPAQESAAQKTEEAGIETIIPKTIKREGEIIEKAVNGEGVTHLGRRALKDYLQDKPQEKELTKEQKIYIEDYLKDKTGSRSLNVGDEISFSEKTIQEAIDASLTLTPNQLKNLEKYSVLVTNL